jgi:hypothetical protein
MAWHQGSRHDRCTVLGGEGVSAPSSLSAPEFLGYTALDGYTLLILTKENL